MLVGDQSPRPFVVMMSKHPSNPTTLNKPQKSAPWPAIATPPPQRARQGEGKEGGTRMRGITWGRFTTKGGQVRVLDGIDVCVCQSACLSWLLSVSVRPSTTQTMPQTYSHPPQKHKHTTKKASPATCPRPLSASPPRPRTPGSAPARRRTGWAICIGSGMKREARRCLVYLCVCV